MLLFDLFAASFGAPSHCLPPRLRTSIVPVQTSTLEAAGGGLVHHSKFWLPMSALGQKQTSAHVRVMSALPAGGAALTSHSFPILSSHSLKAGRSTSISNGQPRIECGDSHGCFTVS